MKTIIPIILAIVVLGGLLFLANRSEKVLIDGLPEKEVCASASEAYFKASKFAEANGYQLGQVLGTGSMRPFIPASKEGLDPYKTVVAYNVYRKADYDEIQPGDLCTYEPADRDGQLWLHQAAAKDSAGWIMTGLANKHYENWMRVTRANFRGITVKVFTWEQR
jgi:hypothetical protein